MTFYYRHKEYYWPSEWKLEASLSRHYVVTVFNKQMKLYETVICALDRNKLIIPQRNFRYIALDKEGAIRWHYKAISIAADIETGKLDLEI